MKTKQRKRSAYLSTKELPLGKRPISVWGYSKSESFVCRLEITAARIAVYSGLRGKKLVDKFSWEGFVRKLKS